MNCNGDKKTKKYITLLAYHPNGGLGRLRKREPRACRSLAALTFGRCANITAACVVLGTRETISVVVGAANAILRYTRTSTTLVIMSTPEQRVCFRVLAFFWKFDIAAFCGFAHGILVTDLAKEDRVATFAARRRACIAAARAPFTATELVISIVCAAWTCGAHISAADISFCAQESIAILVFALYCQDFPF